MSSGIVRVATLHGGQPATYSGNDQLIVQVLAYAFRIPKSCCRSCQAVPECSGSQSCTHD